MSCLSYLQSDLGSHTNSLQARGDRVVQPHTPETEGEDEGGERQWGGRQNLADLDAVFDCLRDDGLRSLRSRAWLWGNWGDKIIAK